MHRAEIIVNAKNFLIFSIFYYLIFCRACRQAGHCHHCNTYFIEINYTPLFRSHLNRSQVEFLAKYSVEKTSIHGDFRLTNSDRATISRYCCLFGEHAELLNENHFGPISPGKHKIGEILSFIYKKQKNRG